MATVYATIVGMEVFLSGLFIIRKRFYEFS